MDKEVIAKLDQILYAQAFQIAINLADNEQKTNFTFADDYAV